MSWFGVMGALACALVLPAAGAAQSPWLGAERPPRLAAEFFRPGFDAHENMKSASSALYLSGRLQGNESVAIVFELPLAFGGLVVDDNASAQPGNPYVGLLIGRMERTVWLELGGRLPLVGADANSGAIVGELTDIDRMSAFAVQMAVLSGALNVGVREPSGLGFRVRAGPDFLLATGMNDKSETLIYYGAQVGYVRGPLELSLHGSGVWVATEAGNFGKRSLHQAGISASYGVGRVRPGVTLRRPLDKDLTESLRYVIGVSLQVPLQ